jgi:deoxyguanosine kinase
MSSLASANLEERPLPRYIVVEGPIGVGKTTLARRLGDSFGHQTLLESGAENPFLERFYREGRRHALSTQLYFLLQRAQRIEEIRSGELFSPRVVADFLIQKDQLFAEVTLDASELALYRQIHANVALEAPAPDLVIYLQAPAAVLLDRIRRRGIETERSINPDYLCALIEAYTRFFYFYEDAPLLIVNAAKIDLVNNQNHYQELLNQVLQMNGARQYFNPHPTLI